MVCKVASTLWTEPRNAAEEVVGAAPPDPALMENALRLVETFAIPRGTVNTPAASFGRKDARCRSDKYFFLFFVRPVPRGAERGVNAL